MENVLKERRGFTRIKFSTPLRYQIRGLAEFNSTVTSDISLGGVSFVNNKFISLATPVMLEINVLSRILRPAGKVAWSQSLPHSDRYRLGIKFLELNIQEKNYLQDFIDIQTDKL